MRGQSLYYNGIYIALVHTNSIDTRTVMTPDGADYLWTEVTIDINGLINPAETSYQWNPPQQVDNVLPAITYNSIRSRLTTPRGRLSFTNFTSSLFDGPTNLISDVNNGPIPQSLKITQIDGGQTFHIQYSIKFFMIECDLGLGSPAYIANRFSQVHDIDDSFYTNIATNGTAYFRVDILDSAKVVADTFRSKLLPPIPFGFRRQSISFTTDSARNAIQYSCKDVETSYDLGDTQGGTNQAPLLESSYITKADGVYNHSTIPFGQPPFATIHPQTMASMTLKLWGSKNANTWNLTQIAFAIIFSTKLNPNVAKGYIKSLSMTQSVTEKYVEVSVSKLISTPIISPTLMLSPLGGAQSVFPAQGGINPAPPNDYGTRGAAGLLALQSELTSACGTYKPTCNNLGPNSSVGGNGSSVSYLYCGPKPVVSVQPGVILPYNQNKYNRTSSDTNQPITNYKSEKAISSDQGVKQAPVAAPIGPQYTSPGNGGEGPLPSVSIINVTKPMTTVFVSWAAERVNRPPQIPSWNTSDPTRVLKNFQLKMLDVQVMPGNDLLFSVSGTYEYAMIKDITDFNSIAFDSCVWTDVPYGAFQLTSDDLITGLLDPGNGPNA